MCRHLDFRLGTLRQDWEKRAASEVGSQMERLNGRVRAEWTFWRVLLRAEALQRKC